MTLNERAYRTLLRAYPRRFRNDYGDLMVQLFADQVRDARSGRGPGILGLWLRSAGDVFSNATAHHLRKEHPVTISYYQAMTVLLGSTLVALMFTGPIIAVPLFAIGIIGLTVYQRRTGFARPRAIEHPWRTILAGVAMIGLPTALIASPLVSGLEWGTLAFGVAWMAWAVVAVTGLAFVAAGLVQLTSNALQRRSERRAA